ncbi:MAG: c-type cytochrome [Nitrospirae bacterium]|nr:c-type cytochrome [Nitrospirota bacterium]
MKRLGMLLAAVAITLSLGAYSVAAAADAAAPNGQALFETYCASCHRGGGNIINPKKTLKASDMKANGVTEPKHVVKLIRKPGPGMVAYDEKTLSNKDAKAIAEYVINTLGRTAR